MEPLHIEIRNDAARPAPRPRSLAPLAALGAAGALLLAVRALAAAEPDSTPIDPTCPWGRLADGKGHLVRCLTEAEATRLRTPSAFSWSDVQKAAEASLSAVAPAEAAPSASPAPEPPPAAPPGPPQPEIVPLTADVGSVVADTGTLPDAIKSLKKARERLAECVEKNGGLSGDRASIELRFLVQARGRAEGVSIKKKRGMTDAAAKCISGVMDRRFVGYPDAPAVGATASVVIAKKKQ